MSFINRVWNILVKSGLVVFLWVVMFVGAISLFSLTQRGTVYYGDRCKATINEEALNYLKQDEIISYDYELKCNTLYLDLSLKEDLSKELAIALLVRISTYYKSIGYLVDTQVTLKGSDYMILASIIDDGGVSLSISEL